MLSLVLTILFVHIAIYLVNTIGASTIDGLVRRSPIQLSVQIYTPWTHHPVASAISKLTRFTFYI